MVEGARSIDPEERRLAYERVVQAYWKPVYVYLRLRRGASAEDAEDLTQGFFARDRVILRQGRTRWDGWSECSP